MFGKNKSGGIQKFCLLDEAIVDETIFPQQRGRVKYGGSYWPAYSLQNVIIMKNISVLVIGKDIERMALIVKINQPEQENIFLTSEKNSVQPDTINYFNDLPTSIPIQLSLF